MGLNHLHGAIGSWFRAIVAHRVAVIESTTTVTGGIQQAPKTTVVGAPMALPSIDEPFPPPAILPCVPRRMLNPANHPLVVADSHSVR
jgi:hypothetical protein